MISRLNRFHGHNSLTRVYRGGSASKGPLLSLRFKLNNTDKPYRAAVVVSKKVAKSAVVRNRIRRRVFEALRPHGPVIRPGSEFIITVFSARVAEMPFGQLSSQLEGQLHKAKIIAGAAEPPAN